MTTVIIYNSGSTQKPFSVASTVAFEARKHDSNVTVLDVENFTYIHQGLPPAWYAKLFGHEVYPGAFQQYLRSIDVGYRILESPRSRRVKPELTAEVAAELEDAIRSDLFTYFRTDRLEDHPILAPYTARKIRSLTEPLFWVLVNYFRSQKVATVYVPNGRVAHQRLALLAAREAGCKLRFYEIGRAVPDSAYIGDCQIHDREDTQAEARIFAAGADKKRMKRVAKEWLNRRMMPESPINKFSQAWSSAVESPPSFEKRTHQKKAVFFTSSADEFSSYGSRWASQTWATTFEAFEAIASHLEKSDVAMTLRVHPNLVNKGRKYFRREMRHLRELQARHPRLRILPHIEPVNSYSLVEESDFIFVGRSTLGLEASLLSKCVWTTTPARYDEIADVRKLHSIEDVTDRNLCLWTADPSGAEAFVSYWASQDHLFAEEFGQWATWNTSHPPISLRIGQIFVANPLLHKLQLIASEVRKHSFSRRPSVRHESP